MTHLHPAGISEEEPKAVLARREVAFGLNNLEISHHGSELLEDVRRFIKTEVDPGSEEFYRLGSERPERWSFAAGQLEILDGLKNRAKSLGLWNLCLQGHDSGAGLTNLDYAYIAFELGKNPLAPECLNCSAPDSGNMEVLERVGTPTQKRKWLAPLLDGSVRSAFAMTEPNVASSDARNISCVALVDGEDLVINGEKFFVTGAGDPRCRFLIVLVRTHSDCPANGQHSQVIVPLPHPGVQILESMQVFGHDHSPYGHMHIRFTEARVPLSNVLLGLARGLEVSALRLGHGRIHHCMRSIGAAEKALHLGVRRGNDRLAFGKPLVSLGKNVEWISRARGDIEAMRLIVLKAARAMDVLDSADAKVWISMAKAMVPERVCQIVDQAIQIHGAAGLSQWTPLAEMYLEQRTMRIVDGPDEVHHMVVGRAEIAAIQTRHPTPWQ